MSDQLPGDPGRLETITRTIGIDELTSCPVAIKCMGRTYTAAAVDGIIQIHDRTDITNPRPLGSASPAPAVGDWELTDPRGFVLAHTHDLLHALSLLRLAQWPPLDQSPGGTAALARRRPAAD
ncbi:hypothetical protein ABTY61_36195 [Kitasatospora sp. NPDC096128]|uniref:hypothetical protein n=1 Tax=Kitasatospora sp. NPDC096128 TaxID=3155547 RepID=UPI003325A960